MPRWVRPLLDTLLLVFLCGSYRIGKERDVLSTDHSTVWDLTDRLAHGPSEVGPRPPHLLLPRDSRSMPTPGHHIQRLAALHRLHPPPAPLQNSMTSTPLPPTPPTAGRPTRAPAALPPPRWTAAVSELEIGIPITTHEPPQLGADPFKHAPEPVQCGLGA